MTTALPSAHSSGTTDHPSPAAFDNDATTVTGPSSSPCGVTALATPLGSALHAAITPTASLARTTTPSSAAACPSPAKAASAALGGTVLRRLTYGAYTSARTWRSGQASSVGRKATIAVPLISA